MPPLAAQETSTSQRLALVISQKQCRNRLITWQLFICNKSGSFEIALYKILTRAVAVLQLRLEVNAHFR